MPTRLEKLQKYLNEAEEHPIKNNLYIEDLKLSIEYEMTKPAGYQVMILEDEDDLEKSSTI